MQIEFQKVQQIINGLNMRLMEMSVQEARGRKVNERLRRSLKQKRNEAHKQLKLVMGKPKH